MRHRLRSLCLRQSLYYRYFSLTLILKWFAAVVFILVRSFVFRYSFTRPSVSQAHNECKRELTNYSFNKTNNQWLNFILLVVWNATIQTADDERNRPIFFLIGYTFFLSLALLSLETHTIFPWIRHWRDAANESIATSLVTSFCASSVDNTIEFADRYRRTITHIASYRWVWEKLQESKMSYKMITRCKSMMCIMFIVCSNGSNRHYRSLYAHLRRSWCEFFGQWIRSMSSKCRI